MVITNSGNQFIDRKLAKFYKSLGIKHVTSSMKHPYTDDQDEVDNKTIVAKLKQSFGEAKDSWVDELPEVL